MEKKPYPFLWKTALSEKHVPSKHTAPFISVSLYPLLKNFKIFMTPVLIAFPPPISATNKPQPPKWFLLKLIILNKQRKKSEKTVDFSTFEEVFGCDLCIQDMSGVLNLSGKAQVKF